MRIGGIGERVALIDRDLHHAGRHDLEQVGDIGEQVVARGDMGGEGRPRRV